MKTTVSFGFTLAELLIALGILGVIAAFMIPKVLQSQQDQKMKAVKKETLAMMSDIAYQAKLENKMNSIAEFNQYVLDHVNAIKICPTNSGSEGCRVGGPHWDMNEPGFNLANGAFVSLATWDDNCGSGTTYYIAQLYDWNGNAPPNVLGEDEITLMTVYKTGANLPQGTVTVYCRGLPSGGASEQNVYDSWFQ